jgi:hypothetical protein
VAKVEIYDPNFDALGLLKLLRHHKDLKYDEHANAGDYQISVCNRYGLMICRVEYDNVFRYIKDYKTVFSISNIEPPFLHSPMPDKYKLTRTTYDVLLRLLPDNTLSKSEELRQYFLGSKIKNEVEGWLK